VIDLDARQVLRDGQPVHVSHKAFELLKILITERPRAISKSELHDRIWPGTFVSDDSLAGLAADVRAAIGDRSRNPQFLRTVHGFGYAFAPVAEEPRHPPAAQPGCWVIAEGRAIALAEGENVIGRDPMTDVVLDSTRVSRRHARIIVLGASAELEDLGSRNGTSVNGTRVSGRVAISDGDKITVGGFRLRFRSGLNVPPTEAEE
jgi:DNA-binding winged helix-turn-helix (wHTH) protein